MVPQQICTVGSCLPVLVISPFSLAEAIALKKENRCDGLSFSRCDRLSRRFDAALQIALDCKKNGLALRFVRENQWLRPDDEPMQFVLFVLQAFGVHTQTGISIPT